MAKYHLIVMTNPVEGKEQEFNDWYDNQHIRDVLAVPGIVSAQRLKAADSQLGNRSSPYRYLAVYEVEVENLKGRGCGNCRARQHGKDAKERCHGFEQCLHSVLEPTGPKIEDKP